jgi:hypothetical protein
MTHHNLPVAESASHYAQRVMSLRALPVPAIKSDRRAYMKRLRCAENLVLDCARINIQRMEREAA